MRPLMPLLALAASLLTTVAAYADLGDQLAKLLPDDGGADDWFGHSVAISGTTAVVGAFFDEDNGADFGSAYLFDISDPASPIQLAKLLPKGEGSGSLFGWSVAIDGSTAIVGAYGDNENGGHAGAAYLYDTTTGEQLAKLLPNDGAAQDQFGRSVAISGTIAIVGAFWNDDNGANSGSAYLFDVATGRQIAKLLPDDGSSDDRFGWSVAISGTTAIIGAHHDDDQGDNSGSAYLFDTTTGLQIAKLLPKDGAEDDQFGFSVAISGATAIVGAHWDDDNGVSSGSAYLFNISDPPNPVQLFKLLADDGAQIDHFGTSVAISNTTAIIGAWSADGYDAESTGSAYLFDTTAGKQIAKLLAKDGALNDQFGVSVAISGAPGNETAIVGAWLDEDNGPWSGSAYLFDAVVETTTIAPDDFSAFRGFLASGTLADVLESDDSDLCYEPGIVLNPTEAPITLDFLGSLPNDAPASLDVTIESSANTVGLGLTISFWNYNTNSWDVVGTDSQTNNVDTVRTFAGDPVEHVEPGTGEVRTRYEVRVISFIFLFPWTDCVDHVFWTTTG